MIKQLQVNKHFVMLLFAIFLGTGTVWAYDFSATCSTGQTLYYSITDVDNHYVSVVAPDGSWWGTVASPTGAMTIPETVAYNNVTYTVTSIGDNSFYWCDYLTSVVIPNSVTTIGSGAFSSCDELKSIAIPNSVTFIGDQAFSNCSKLTSITIPSSVTSIEMGTFRNCWELTSVTIPNSVTSIGDAAFEECSSLGTVAIPNSVTHIGNAAFYGCSLTSITIPASVTCIDGNLFPHCNSLNTIIVESGNMVFDSRDNCNAIIHTETNTLQSGCKNTIIPNSVTTIGDGAFGECSGLTSIVIPSSVTSIGDFAFSMCEGLISMDIPVSVTSIGESAFEDCTGLTSIVLPNTLTTIGTRMLGWCSSLSSIEIPASVSSIGDLAFAVCDSLTSIVSLALVPPTLGNDVFYSDDLSAISLYVHSASVSSYLAAEGWNELNILPLENEEAITFADDNVKAICIANWDTNGDGELSYVEAAAVTDLGTVFRNHTEIISFDELQYFVGLTTITGGTSQNQLGAFRGCQSLQSIVLPNSINSIGDFAFFQCYELSTIEIPYGVITIGNGAFMECGGLTGSLIIPNSVTTIGEWAFSGCDGFSGSLVIPNSVTTIGQGAFSGCLGFTGSLTIPNTLSIIGNSAFEMCESLTGLLVIPNSVTTIGNSAFFGCGGFSDLSIPNSVTMIGSDAFGNCCFNCYLHIPNSVTAIGDRAFNGCGACGGEGGSCFDEISIVSLAPIPPALGNDVFCLDDPTVISVYVPCGSEAAYQEAPGWGDFSIFTNGAEPCIRQIEVVVNPEEGGAVEGDGSYVNGSNCTLTATPNDGYTFVNWTENDEVVSTEASYTFTVTQDRNLMANFTAIIPEPSDYSQEYFTITSWEPENTITFHRGVADLDMYISYDKINWNLFTSTSNTESTVVLGIGEKAYFKAITNKYDASDGWGGEEQSLFSAAKLFEASGNIMSLFSGDDFVGATSFCSPDDGYIANLSGLFIGATTLLTLENLVLPATQYNSWVYQNIASHCSSLIKAPKELPAQTYQGDNTLVWMFADCPKLQESPVIRLTSNASGDGWYAMFSGCSSLKRVICLMEGTDLSVTGYAWLYNVPSDGVFYKNPSSTWQSGNHAIPSSWTTRDWSEDPSDFVKVTSTPAYRYSCYVEGTSDYYQSGDIVTLKCTPINDYVFNGWYVDGTLVSSSDTYSFTASQDIEVTPSLTLGALTGALNGVFSVGEGQQVYFSQGNLQYQASTNTWRFAENQWDYVGEDNANVSSSYDGWIDLFGWGTSGFDHGAVCYQPWSTSDNPEDYYAYGDPESSLNDLTGMADWGYNSISNGGDILGQWRTLTREEWVYVFDTRPTMSGIRWVKGKVNDVCGVILLPDNWNASYYTLNNTNGACFDNNIITAMDWMNIFEANGAVFLPAAGRRYGDLFVIGEPDIYGGYWSASSHDNDYAWDVFFGDSDLTPQGDGGGRCFCESVRLVRPASAVTSYNIEVVPNPAEGGTVTGAGSYVYGSTCTLTATANEGYVFVNWTETISEGEEMVVNGGFEDGNTCFESDPIENGGWATVGSDAFEFHSGGEWTGAAHTGSMFLIVDGSTIPNKIVWEQQIAVLPDTYYVFSAWACNICDVNPDPAMLQFCINGQQIGEVLSVPTTSNNWIRFYQTWYSGDMTEASIVIYDQNTEYMGNDFGLDEISFRPVETMEVSTDATYTFTVDADRTLMANFTYNGGSGGHAYVDLGLPSGLLWATCNVGANNPEDYGDYFAWGETQPKDTYDWSTYQYCNGSEYTLTKYCSISGHGYNGFTDDLTTLLPEDDAATANWGGNWRMPTQAEFQELLDNMTVTWTTQNGVEGMLFVATNGNSLFLPAAGCRRGDMIDVVGSFANYWSSSLYTDNPNYTWIFSSNSDGYGMCYDSRNSGQSVRAVRSSQNITTYVIDAIPSPAEGGAVSGDGAYESGAECTLTATANDGYVFVNWTENDEEVSTDATYIFTVDADRILVANFAEEGSFCDLVLYLYDSYGDGWTGNKLVVTHGDGNTEEITLDGGSSSEQTLSVVNGDHITLSWINGRFTKDCSFNVCYSNGNVICHGENMSDDFTYEFDVDCEEMPESQIVIEASVEPAEGGTVSGAGLYGYGSTCTLTATPNEGYVFLYWTENDAVVSHDAEYTIELTVTVNRNLVAHFAEEGSLCDLILYLSDSDGDGWSGNKLVVTHGDGSSEKFTLDGGSSSEQTLSVVNGDHITLSWIKGNYTDDCSFIICYSNGNVICRGENLSGEFSFEFDVDCETMPETSFEVTASAAPAEGGTVSGAGSYGYASCMLTATPSEGYVFMYWTENDAVVSYDAEYTFEVTRDRDLVAHFAEEGSLCDLVFYLYDSHGDGWNGNELVVNHEDGTSEEITLGSGSSGEQILAVANGDHITLSWILGSYTRECSFNICYSNGNVIYHGEKMSVDFSYEFDVDCEEMLATAFEVTASMEPAEGGAVSGAGSFCYGSTCTLTATPNEGYTFMYWTLNDAQVSSDAEYSFTVIGDCELVAHFTLPFTITATSTPTEGGTIGGDGTYEWLSTCTLTATPNEGYVFMYWTENDAMVSRDSEYTFEVTQDRNLVAHFAEEGSLCDLVFYLYDSYGNGWEGNKLVVTHGDGVSEEITLDEGSSGEQTLAVVNGDHITLSWIRGVFTNECSFNICYSNGNVIYQGENMSDDFTYEFDVDCEGTLGMVFEVTASIEPAEGGAVSGAGSYAYGSTCTMTATANDGFRFINWTENDTEVSIDNTISFVVTEDRQLVANFSQVNNYWTSPIGMSGSMTILGILKIDGVEPYADYLEIGAFSGEECRGSALPDMNNGLCIYYLNIAGNTDGDPITFRLYDHQLDQELDLYCTNEMTFVDGMYYGSDEFYEFNFVSLVQITATADPEEGGTVEGTGIYGFGQTCTLTASSAEGYHFINWTKDGEEVSTEENYVFTVTEDGNFVAHFALNSYEVSVSVDPAEAGSVEGAGVYLHGETCELTATVIYQYGNYQYKFLNWTENGEVLSTDNTISFVVTEDRQLVANFSQVNNYWTSPIGMSGSMTILGILKIDGVEPYADYLEIGAFSGEECRGSALPDMSNGLCVYYLNVSGNTDGDPITFLLYDHQLGQELDLYCTNEMVFENDMSYGSEEFYEFNFVSLVQITATADPEEGGTVEGAGAYGFGQTCTLTAIANDGFQFNSWIVDGETVSNEATYVFEVSGPVTVTALFEMVQTVELNQGWTWWSANVEQSGIDGLSVLENSLNPYGRVIKTTDKFVQYQVQYGQWMGGLTNLTNEEGYRIQTTEACSVSMAGSLANPEDHPITLNPNWTWIGYPVAHQQTVNEALSGLEPVTNDLIKGQGSSARYVPSVGWIPADFTLNPGESYMYYSKASDDKTLVYANGRSEVEPKGDDRHWRNDIHAYGDNLCLLAVVKIDGEEQRSEEIEVGAFVNGECRGSARLMYVEYFDRYYAMMNVMGEEGDEVEFALIDSRRDMTSVDSPTRLTFAIDAIVGEFDDPFVVSFGGLTSTEEHAMRLVLYPNPVVRNEEFRLLIPDDETVVEWTIVNALGAVVRQEKGMLNKSIVEGLPVSGVYVVRVVCKSGNVYRSRLVVK